MGDLYGLTFLLCCFAGTGGGMPRTACTLRTKWPAECFMPVPYWGYTEVWYMAKLLASCGPEGITSQPRSPTSTLLVRQLMAKTSNKSSAGHVVAYSWVAGTYIRLQVCRQSCLIWGARYINLGPTLGRLQPQGTACIRSTLGLNARLPILPFTLMVWSRALLRAKHTCRLLSNCTYPPVKSE